MFITQGVLRDDTHVAVKCLSVESKQGTIEFLTEINVISSIKHPNLVQLIGCCVEDGNRILVYEYLENNSLASALLGNLYSFPKFHILILQVVKSRVMGGLAGRIGD